jgi:hypothetical protein
MDEKDTQIRAWVAGSQRVEHGSAMPEIIPVNRADDVQGESVIYT